MIRYHSYPPQLPLLNFQNAFATNLGMVEIVLDQNANSDQTGNFVLVTDFASNRWTPTVMSPDTLVSVILDSKETIVELFCSLALPTVKFMANAWKVSAFAMTVGRALVATLVRFPPNPIEFVVRMIVRITGSVIWWLAVVTVRRNGRVSGVKCLHLGMRLLERV